jgi:hypothetical protein
MPDHFFKPRSVQERLLEEISSDKAEKDRLVPTAKAIAMLGKDEKALSASVLRKVMSDPPDDESLVEAVRHMPSDPDASAELIALMKDEKVPLAAREMIPEMVSDADPNSFLSAAEDVLKVSKGQDAFAPSLVKAVARVSAPEAAEAVKSTKNAIAELLDAAPEAFKSAASELLDGDDTA